MAHAALVCPGHEGAAGECHWPLALPPGIRSK
jgi:hypothetical protein